MSIDRRPGETEWVYESLVRSVPVVNVSRTAAIAVQLIGFEGAILVLSWYHGLPEAALVGTAGVLVSIAGSVFMLRLSGSIRAVEVPDQYRDLLFGSRIEVVLGLLSFFVLVVYMFVYDPRQPGEALVTTVLGNRPPLLFSYVLLMVGWDVAYRIGVGWWASVLGLWRSIRFGGEMSESTRRRLRGADGLTIGFAGVQLLLLPVLSGHPLLQFVIVGHVLAVVVVSGVSILHSRRQE
ncbi:MAG: DUF7530 family protein [Halodesulfurarchaeum sp.]